MFYFTFAPKIALLYFTECPRIFKFSHKVYSNIKVFEDRCLK